ncbi:MAG: hypothetical protein SOR56_03495 [Oscillospiraceae bacterium]|nr:hypothetical protein [Oscillospiraceae bacterium]
MKSLQIIQKTYHVFEILLRIGMIAAFIWVAISAAGVICAIVWQDSIAALLQELTGISGTFEIIGSLLCSLIAALADGILCLLALRYVKAEQADGTPFTFSGAQQLKRLGIQTIVIPLVAQILSAVVYEIFDATFQPEWFDGGSIIIGVVLILVALVFRYGAELEEARSEE